MTEVKKGLTYKEQLLTPEWKARRLQILERDNYTCKKCGNKTRLQIHHKKYIKGKMAWESPDKHLITLCRPCHQKEHNIGSDKIKYAPILPNKRRTRKKKNPNKPKKKVETRMERIVRKSKLTARDKKLQERYTQLRREGKLA